jgi:23S rRNA (pseudouridine1915-N3)-methyltransferase
MKFRIIAIGNNMPNWVDNACDEYLKRLQIVMPTEIITCTTKDRKHKNAIAKANRDESAWLWQQRDAGGYTVSLDRCGDEISTLKLASKITNWQHTNINILIGGPEGIDENIIKQSDEVWSLSKLTFAHPIARIVILEQLFRAWAINNNHPYHR